MKNLKEMTEEELEKFFEIISISPIQAKSSKAFITKKENAEKYLKALQKKNEGIATKTELNTIARYENHCKLLQDFLNITKPWNEYQAKKDKQYNDLKKRLKKHPNSVEAQCRKNYIEKLIEEQKDDYCINDERKQKYDEWLKCNY